MTAAMRHCCDDSPHSCHCLAQFPCRNFSVVGTGPAISFSRQRQLGTLRHTVLRLASAGLLAGAAVFLVPGFVDATAQDREGWPQSLTIGTEADGSAYALYGTGMAELLSEDLGMEVSTSLTGGAFQNAALMRYPSGPLVFPSLAMRFTIGDSVTPNGGTVAAAGNRNATTGVVSAAGPVSVRLQ